MPIAVRLIRRLSGCVVAAVALALLVAGCGGSPKPVASPQPSASSPTTSGPTPTPTPTRTGPGPMTKAELDWLAAVTKMHAKADAAFAAKRVVLTAAKMRSFSAALGECRRVLRAIGAPTARLGPVLTLVKKACALFDKGAKCYLTAAKVSDSSGAVEAGTPAERIQSQALDCGLAGYNDGTNALSDAEAEGERLKQEAG